MKKIGKCGEWKGDPPKGQMTPRESVGFEGKWEILFWKVPGKGRAAQIHERDNGEIAYKIFFSTESEAKSFLYLPDLRQPTIEEIEAAIEECPWTEPSRGRRQKWFDLF
ncbi:MAG: hypothetical protein NTY33_00740 [Candidatus Moranbacteria bacterium]|nr:hypothetical protein [Candidatus Moranbacteria bacterium]